VDRQVPIDDTITALTIDILFFSQKPLPQNDKLKHGYSAPTKGTPIQVTPKPKRQRRLKNIFLDDRGFPDQFDKFDQLLHNFDGGPVLRKL
jgi:hypothetical protein